MVLPDTECNIFKELINALEIIQRDKSLSKFALVINICACQQGENIFIEMFTKMEDRETFPNE